MSHEHKRDKVSPKSKAKALCPFLAVAPDATCFLSKKRKGNCVNGEVPKIRRKIRLIQLNWSACRSGSSWGTLRVDELGDGTCFRLAMMKRPWGWEFGGSPRPPVGWRPGRPRRHPPSHAHPAHVDDEGGHGVEGMCFVRGMLQR